jgi:hypothetical protein
MLNHLLICVVLQPEWFINSADLPACPPDIYSDFTAFLHCVASWLSERSKAKQRNRLACDIIRETCKVWAGIGVYTVCELFFDSGMSITRIRYQGALIVKCSGLSPFLSETEVFDNPSRTARLCAAFYSFAKRSHEDMWYVVFYFNPLVLH